jgi:uncharacterized protein YecT (DUF1311 family)
MAFGTGKIAVGTALLTAFTASASSEQTANINDGAAIEACLALVTKNEAAPGLREEDTLTEAPGPEGRLKAAAETAPRQPSSCIGVVANPCHQAGGYRSNAGEIQCYDRETAVLDSRLNKAYKTALESADEKDLAEGYRKMQRSWIAFRDATCAMPWLIQRGTMANPLKAHCMMEMTARQALWFGSEPVK